MRPAHSVSSTKRAPSKKAINISLATDVYLEAKKFGIDISQFCEERLRDEIRARKERQWNEQHGTFLVAYNSLVEEEGVALREWRPF